MSTRIDMERLSAYLDGELAPEEMTRVKAELENSPEDRAAVERLRRLNARLVTAYEAPHRAPLPPALLRSVTSATGSRRRRWSWTTAGMAMAASIVTAAMFLGLRSNEPAADSLAPGRLDQGSALHALLESEPSGGTATLDGGTATLLSSFLDGAERPCREVEVAGNALGSRTQMVACRHGGSWTVEFAISGMPGPAESRDTFVPASGAEDAAFRAALDTLGAGPVLGPAAEEDLIERDWQLR